MTQTRREFLKLSLAALGALAFRSPERLADFPSGERLGRNCVGGIINIRAKPSAESASVGQLYEDSVVVWLREVVGEAPAGVLSRRWVETPEGYLYAPSIQPVKYLPNEPILSLPLNETEAGFWGEITVPYVDIILANPPARSPWFQEVTAPRLYYGQVMWIDEVQALDPNNILYRVSEKYGTYGDVFWAPAEAFRPITSEELSPIHPDAGDKKVVVDVNHQLLSCYEGKNEVFFCRCSTGAKFDAQGNAVDEWSTPVGPHPIWRKLISIHMSGGGTGAGWDTPGIGWTSLFAGDGVAVHSTFWHNDFGTPRSHGCVNVLPEDAKWIFRWTLPYVSYIPGDLTVQMPGGTIVDVVEA